mmetsp:Transcript_31076/g.54030  ORF Transcript_31076/g.54030 Transcript_31076/m.54030 type:complete len:422 (+) Transcript_31076:326-1591(+)|eukprot:CAMPEP_0204912734 /NCGR_PEP_ID=MMETSP1397-20131031/10834_1 /ASSEMBLY_ACC=CAM_ASM_000891 /TAXON_ID=49980 /ORGANISM="Climacostomum Climacostomum virens, Strain Stock W-24" /LENGTH=421 /DNA_ID=CAMNT_0052083807 /DNA_START=233 /DNA_END=1498 /DNA_ORIENTATION=-
MYKININAVDDIVPTATSRPRNLSMSSTSSPKSKPKIKFASNTPKLPALLNPSQSQASMRGANLSPCSPQATTSLSKTHGSDSVKKAYTPMFKVPKLLKAVCPLKSNGLVKSYAANTSIGIVRTYNEDRISISYRIARPKNKLYDNWPTCSWFGLFDGHAGSQCADFLRDNLLHYVVNQDSFPSNPRSAILDGFREAETCFLNYATSVPEKVERSGSCAVVVLIVGSTAYVANVGDSRAVLSMDRGLRFENFTNDHKPNDPNERARIYSHGGEVYFRTGSSFTSYATGENSEYIVHRVLPGRLSVSRTFGDVDAKLAHLGGKPGVVIAEPEIRVYEIRDNYDFILMGCDGIFDKLSSSDAIETCWRAMTGEKSAGNFHAHCGTVVNALLTRSMNAVSTDNVTALIIAFKNLQNAYKGVPPS